MRASTVFSALVVLLALPVRTVPGQEVGAAITGMSLRVTRQTADTILATGSALGFDARFGVSAFSLTLQYRQGHVASPNAAIDQDYVEGAVIVAAEPARWIRLSAGPHVRAYVEPSGTERWLMWEARLRLRARLMPAVGAWVEGWRVLASDLNVAEDLDRAYGLDGGLRVRLAGIASLQLRYRAEHADLGGGARRETVEQLAAAFVLGTAW